MIENGDAFSNQNYALVFNWMSPLKKHCDSWFNLLS